MSNYIIIGASSGIGQQLALQLTNAGHQAYATYFSRTCSINSGELYCRVILKQ